jgi:enoyl-CoA hydratase/carnithine racemase
MQTSLRPDDAAHSDELLVERAGGVVTLTLNRPHHKNAVTGKGWQLLLAALLDVSADRDRVVVIRGAGDDFCAGADLMDDYSAVSDLDRVAVLGDACLALHRLPVPTVARVDGVAVGAGMNLALACDFVVATDRSRFSEIFVRRGLSLDFGGSWLLPRLIGLRAAKRLVLLGDIITAHDAQQLGLVDGIVRPEDLDSSVADIVDRLLAGAPVAQRLSKALLHGALEMGLASALDAESAAQVVNLRSQDAAEAAAAFKERRTAVFTGH